MGNLSHESAWNTNFLGAVGSPDPQDGFSDGKARLPAVSRHDFCHVTAGNWTKLTAVALSRAVSMARHLIVHSAQNIIPHLWYRRIILYCIYKCREVGRPYRALRSSFSRVGIDDSDKVANFVVGIFDVGRTRN
jgi:hypothetical protein